MITVVGEALIDLVVDQDGHATAQPGGGPFNTARTVARLGLAPVFLGRLSGDGFGRALRAHLDQDGVALGIPQPADSPTTLATVDVDEAGAPRYGFYLGGTASADLEYQQLSAALPAGATVLHAGTLALAMEPIASAIEHLIASDLPQDALLMIDPNCRPQAIPHRKQYLARLSRILRRADVVKASVEDLAYLFPGLHPHAAAAALLHRGPALVFVTDGPHAARAFLPGRRLTADVPEVKVADTIGAGDAFGGAFLAWWSGHELTRSDLRRPEEPGPVREALRAAVEVAALTCTRVGAEPPWLAEVRGRPGWDSVQVTRFRVDGSLPPGDGRRHEPELR